MKKFLVRLLILIVVVAALLYGGLRYLAGSVKASPHAYAKKEFIREMAQDARISKVLPLALSRRELDGYLKEEALPEDLPYTLVTEAGTPGGGATPAAAGTAEDDPPAVQSAAPADSARTEEELTRAREGYTDENGKIFLQLTEQAEDGITVFRVSGPSYLGNVMLIDDASRISLQTKGAYGGGGGSAIGPIADRHGAVAALNGGGFDDPEGKGDGGTPEGYVISNGAIVYGGGAGAYHMVGFNKENKLVIGVMGPGAAIGAGVRDAICLQPWYGPTLIVNGEPRDLRMMTDTLDARTAMGQRADGTVVFATVNGRQGNSQGANFPDMVELMMFLDCENASCLDGGASTQMYYRGEYLNVSPTYYGQRRVGNAFLVAPVAAGEEG
ncbi:MAG: phosphodiester glycosidase family protein [Lachnospiraceae bacterium]|nr:phosphodiester glycosidase family protein [Lachnospiraceae bacterium]